MELRWEILDAKRRAILPFIGRLKGENFYLAGGTALALLIGHRDSIDFDFFTVENFDTEALFERLRDTFEGHAVIKTQEETNTLSVLVDGEIRISFMRFPYPLVRPAFETQHFPIASIEDIACMKLSAIAARSAFKDYVDLYFILKTHPLADILSVLREKMPTLDPLLALKSLAYLDDVHEEPITFKTTPVSLREIRDVLTHLIEQYPRNL